MKKVPFLAASALAILAVAGCGGTLKPNTSCTALGCPSGQTCNPNTGQCGGGHPTGGGSGGIGGGGGGFAAGGGGGGVGIGGGAGGNSAAGGGTGGTGGTGGGGAAGGGGSGCSPACSGVTPVCNNGVCVTCTALAGCMAPTPYCLTGAPGGLCVQCRNDPDCAASGMICEGSTSTCVPVVPPPPDAGTDGGTGGGGGVSDGGFPFCVPRDAGVVVACTLECPQGFHCLSGACVLNGASGPVQVTLRWNTHEDLDLHLDEPTDAGHCEIYYGDPNRVGNPSFCGAHGSLDLDSEPACPIPPDYVDVENIIYPPGMPAPSGTYTVRVDHYAACQSGLMAVPFQVEVRNNGVLSGFCGVFVPTDPEWNDHGGVNGGRQVMTFVVP